MSWKGVTQVVNVDEVRLIQGAGWRTESCTGRSNGCVHAPDRPLRGSCASPVLRDSTAQGCQGIAWAALPGCCSSFSQGHSVLPGQRFEDPRCVLLRCLPGCRLLPTRPADLCLCAAQPSSSGLCVRPQTGRLLVSPAAGTRASLVPAHPAAHSAAHTVQPITRSRAHRAASAQTLCSGAAVHAALCTAQAALSSTSIPPGTKTVSAAMACQDSPR